MKNDWNHHCLCGATMRLMSHPDPRDTGARVFWCPECGTCAVHTVGYPVQRHRPAWGQGRHLIDPNAPSQRRKD